MVTNDPSHLMADRNSLEADLVNLHFNKIMFFIEKTAENYLEKRTEQILIERNTNRLMRFKTRKQLAESHLEINFQNVCGDFRYIEAINFMTNDEDLEAHPPPDIGQLTYSEYIRLKEEKQAAELSLKPEPGKTETIFKRNKASFLEESRPG